MLKIRNEAGEWKEGDEEVEKVMRNYFIDLFTLVNTCNMHQVLEVVEPRVTTEMDDLLLQPYTEAEIKKALKQMHPTKALGPDGMPPLFFLKLWHTNKACFVDTCLNILNRGLTLHF